MTPEEALEAAIDILGGKSALAKIVNEASPERPCTPQAVTQWRRCPRERVVAVAAAVRKAKARKFPTEHELCPEYFPRAKKSQ
jgi:hypothetical protein